MTTFVGLPFTSDPGSTSCSRTYSFAATSWLSFIFAVNGWILKPETGGLNKDKISLTGRGRAFVTVKGGLHSM
jgi:hypothetical protein